MSKHANGTPACAACEAKLKDAHHDLGEWFRDHVKSKYPDAHISWSFRDQANQDQCFSDGKSKLKFPMSAHNKSDDAGNPCSMALDLFQLDYNGVARWAFGYFRNIADDAEALGLPIFWGGKWPHLGDSDHYSLKKES